MGFKVLVNASIEKAQSSLNENGVPIFFHRWKSWIHRYCVREIKQNSENLLFLYDFQPRCQMLPAAYDRHDFQAIAPLQDRLTPIPSLENFTVIFHGNQLGIETHLRQQIRKRSPQRRGFELAIDMQFDHLD
jgi:hypothetical protein